MTHLSKTPEVGRGNRSQLCDVQGRKERPTLKRRPFTWQAGGSAPPGPPLIRTGTLAAGSTVPLGPVTGLSLWEVSCFNSARVAEPGCHRGGLSEFCLRRCLGHNLPPPPSEPGETKSLCLENPRERSKPCSPQALGAACDPLAGSRRTGGGEGEGHTPKDKDTPHPNWSLLPRNLYYKNILQAKKFKLQLYTKWGLFPS